MPWMHQLEVLGMLADVSGDKRAHGNHRQAPLLGRLQGFMDEPAADATSLELFWNFGVGKHEGVSDPGVRGDRHIVPEARLEPSCFRIVSKGYPFLLICCLLHLMLP